MNTQPLFTLLDLSLNIPDPDTTHHSLGNRQPSNPKTQTYTSQHYSEMTEQRKQRREWRVVGKAQKLESGVPVCASVCAPVSLRDSSYYISGNH